MTFELIHELAHEKKSEPPYRTLLERGSDIRFWDTIGIEALPPIEYMDLDIGIATLDLDL